MARIEISLEEYNSLKDKIKSLEEKNVTLYREAQLTKDKLNVVRSLLFGLDDIGLMDRIINWKAYIKPLNDLFSENEESEESEKEK